MARVPRQMLTPAARLHFDGQLAGEAVLWIKRRSLLSLVTSAWPIIAGLIALVLFTVFGGAIPGVQLLLLAGLVILVASTIWWVSTIGWQWYFEYYILTDRRIIKTHGYPQRHREEIGIKNVAQVRVESKNPLAVFFGVGDIEVRPIGTPMELHGIRYPRDVADSILDAAEGKGRPKAPPPAPPRVANPKLQADLDLLAKQEPMPTSVPNRRTPLMAFLHRKIPIRLLEDEEVVEVVYRHWFILLKRELPAIAVFFGGLVLGTVLQDVRAGGIAPSMVLYGGMVLGLAIALLVYLNWADDVFIVTTNRVIDVDRLFFILANYSDDAPYGRVQQVRVEEGFLGTVMSFGTIVVETSGRKFPVHMRDVPHPFHIMDRIFEQMNLLKEREAVAASNKQKKENHRWMATVLNDMLVSVPELRGLPLLEAIATAQQAGLRLMVESQRPHANAPASQVLEQAPLAGTTVVVDSEVRVSVSGRGVVVAPGAPMAPLAP